MRPGMCASLLVAACGVAGWAAPAQADSQLRSQILGRWQTIDDHTGQARAVVRLYEEHGLIFGRIESAARPDAAELSCIKCTDERKDHPILGLMIIRNMKLEGDEFAGGDILDPDSGDVYRCKMRLKDPEHLLVRGFLGISLFGRSQTWLRAPPST